MFQFGQTVTRERRKRIPDPYNPDETTDGPWDDPDILEISGAFVASSSSADVAGVIAALVARAASSPAGVTSQTIGPASVRHATGKDGANLSIPLLLSEKETIAPYKLQLGA